MSTVTPFLWFDNQAEQAMNFYVSIFPRSRIIAVNGPPGHVMSVEFEVMGQRFMALNGGPAFQFSEAVSWLVSCETQAEIDTFWDKLTADGGAPGRCGWLKDKFGMSWQVVPRKLGELLGGAGEASVAQRVTEAMLQMGKLDIARLEAAFSGR